MTEKYRKGIKVDGSCLWTLLESVIKVRYLVTQGRLALVVYQSNVLVGPTSLISTTSSLPQEVVSR